MSIAFVLKRNPRIHAVSYKNISSRTENTSNKTTEALVKAKIKNILIKKSKLSIS